MVSIGGEIGEVGKENSTEAELRAYLDGYRRELTARAGAEAVGLVQGERPDRDLARRRAAAGWRRREVKLDFGTLERLSAVCRSYGLAGAVQHGASTLPDELFHHFPKVETAEIHLATGFQNALYDHPEFPADLHGGHRGVVLRRTPPTSGRRARPTASSCTRPARRRWAPTSGELWELPTKDAILASQAAHVTYLAQAAGRRRLARRWSRST